MPDITMCLNEKCEVRENCYRFTAMPGFRQYYFSTVIGNDKDCQYYWEVKK